VVKIEIEVDTLAQLEEVLAVGVDAVLLDNMAPKRCASRWSWSGACAHRGLRPNHAPRLRLARGRDLGVDLNSRSAGDAPRHRTRHRPRSHK